jgi:fumarate reductase flavoprotein subunit
MVKTPQPSAASRRQFIKGAAAGAGTLALMRSTQETHAEPPPQRWDSEVDVLIAGAGVSGCFAAITAHDAGAGNILMIEKTTVAGGSGRYSSGTILAAGTILQREKNIQDSAELWYRESMEASENGVDANITRKMITMATEVFDFLWAAGMRWSFIDPLPGYSAPRGYREANGGVKMMKIVVDEVAKRPGIKLQYETRITKLFMDHNKGAYPQGEVIGIECATANGRTQNIKVKKAVALCTGDFAANPAYIESHFPALKNTKFVGNPGNTGDGIRIAQRLGADITGYTPQGHPHCVEVAPGKALLWPRYEFLAQAGAILVNSDGKRFCNEPVKGYYVPLFPEVQKQNGNFACVFDAAMAKAIINSPRFDTTFRGNSAMFTNGLNGDGFVIKKADTLEALAKQLNVSADGLKKTVAAYNDNVAAGKDAEFERNAKYLINMASPPYYGWKGIIGVTTTRGGLRMDAEARILDVDLQPIRRLYGAGGTIGGYTNEAGYRSGLHLTNAFAFGRIAGKNMAAEKPWG